jgi:hypothetical protein
MDDATEIALVAKALAGAVVAKKLADMSPVLAAVVNLHDNPKQVPRTLAAWCRRHNVNASSAGAISAGVALLVERQQADADRDAKREALKSVADRMLRTAAEMRASLMLDRGFELAASKLRASGLERMIAAAPRPSDAANAADAPDGAEMAMSR